MKRTLGFTLIELMIVVAVIAILASLALSGYNNQVRKSRRAEAKQVISDLALRQEKWRLNHTTYGTCNQIAGTDPLSSTACASYNAPLVYYTVTVTGVSATGFTITGTPKGDQLNDKCGTLSLQSAAGVITKTPTTGDCW